MSWRSGDGRQTWDEDASILADYKLVERNGEYYVDVTAVNLGRNWIGDGFLEDVGLPGTLGMLKIGGSHKLEYSRGLLPQHPQSDKVWGAQIHYVVGRVGELYIKIPFIWKSGKLEWKNNNEPGGIVEGTLIVYPSLIPVD